MNSPHPAKTTDPSPDALLACAVAAARKAGHHARLQKAGRGRDTLKIEANDVKLALDVECQHIATTVIKSGFPSHSVLGEEDASEGAIHEWNWVVDPIDGTVNFFHGSRIWCCSIAARHDHEVLAGAVFAPELDLLYEASSTSPATCNGQTIEVSQTDKLALALVHTGADRNAPSGQESFRFLNRIATHVQRPRISGSAALDICEVARGGADAYFESSIYIWDIAAADFILRRAGGTGRPLWTYDAVRMAYLGANPHLFQPLRDLVKPFGPKNNPDKTG